MTDSAWVGPGPEDGAGVTGGALLGSGSEGCGHQTGPRPERVGPSQALRSTRARSPLCLPPRPRGRPGVLSARSCRRRHRSPREASPASRACVRQARSRGSSGGTHQRPRARGPTRPQPCRRSPLHRTPRGWRRVLASRCQGPRGPWAAPARVLTRPPLGARPRSKSRGRCWCTGLRGRPRGPTPHKPGDPEEPEPQPHTASGSHPLTTEASPVPHTCPPGSPRRGPPGAPGPAASGARLAGCPGPQAGAVLC